MQFVLIISYIQNSPVNTPLQLTYADALKKNMSWTPHLTVATVVERDQRFLIIEEHINGHPVLTQPAGHVEANETLIEAAIRETREESGWSVEPVALLGLYSYTTPCKTMTFYRTCFIAKAISYDQHLPLDSGILAVHWLTLEEMKAQQDKMRSPIVIKCIEDYCKGQKFPLQAIFEHTD